MSILPAKSYDFNGKFSSGRKSRETSRPRGNGLVDNAFKALI